MLRFNIGVGIFIWPNVIIINICNTVSCKPSLVGKKNVGGKIQVFSTLSQEPLETSLLCGLVQYGFVHVGYRQGAIIAHKELQVERLLPTATEICLTLVSEFSSITRKTPLSISGVETNLGRPWLLILKTRKATFTQPQMQLDVIGFAVIHKMHVCHFVVRIQIQT